MRAKDRLWKSLSFLSVVLLFEGNPRDAQERVTVSYSSLEAPNSNYFIVQEKSLYQKYRIEAASIFSPASTIVVIAIVAGSVHLGNGIVGSIANVVVRGANVVSV